MIKASVAVKVMSVMVLALLLAACGGAGTAAPTQAPADNSSTSSSSNGSDSSASGSGVSFGITGQMFTANAPDGYSNTAGALSNGKIAVAAAESSLAGVSVQDFANAAATALGTITTAQNNGRTIYYVSYAGGVVLWVSPDNSNVIVLTATKLTDDPANFVDDLLTIAGTVNQQ